MSWKSENIRRRNAFQFFLKIQRVIGMLFVIKHFLFIPTKVLFLKYHPNSSEIYDAFLILDFKHL